MLNVAFATFKKNRSVIRRAFPWSHTFGRFIGGFFTMIFPYFMYTYYFKGNLDANFMEYTNQSDYISYIALGASIHVLGKSTLMNVGRSFITELREGTLISFFLSPASRFGYYLGCFLEQLGRACLEFSVIICLGFLLGAKVLKVFTIESILVLTVTIFSFFAMSMMLSCIMLYTRDTYISQNTLFMIMGLTCGIVFPVEYLPKSIQFISHFFPTTAAIKLFRCVLTLDQSIINNLHLVAEILVLSSIYIFFGMIWFSKLEKKITEEIFA